MIYLITKTFLTTPLPFLNPFCSSLHTSLHTVLSTNLVFFIYDHPKHLGQYFLTLMVLKFRPMALVRAIGTNTCKCRIFGKVGNAEHQNIATETTITRSKHKAKRGEAHKIMESIKAEEPIKNHTCSVDFKEKSMTTKYAEAVRRRRKRE